MTLLGGPVDTRRSATAVNRLATEHDLAWFERNVIEQVPPFYPGAMRKVYPGFIQLTNFISMNLDKHIEAQHELFDHPVKGDDEEAEQKHSVYEIGSASGAVRRGAVVAKTGRARSIKH